MFPELVINRVGPYCLVISVTYEMQVTDSQGIWKRSKWFEDKDIFSQPDNPCHGSLRYTRLARYVYPFMVRIKLIDVMVLGDEETRVLTLLSKDPQFSAVRNPPCDRVQHVRKRKRT